MKDLSKISIGCVVEQNSCLPRRNYFCVVTDMSGGGATSHVAQ